MLTRPRGRPVLVAAALTSLAVGAAAAVRRDRRLEDSGRRVDQPAACAVADP
jgi:hypothetical protein